MFQVKDSFYPYIVHLIPHLTMSPWFKRNPTASLLTSRHGRKRKICKYAHMKNSDDWDFQEIGFLIFRPPFLTGVLVIACLHWILLLTFSQICPCCCCAECVISKPPLSKASGLMQLLITSFTIQIHISSPIVSFHKHSLKIYRMFSIIAFPHCLSGGPRF